MDNWMPVIFIVLTIAMAVGPVLMLKPSKRQQGIANLRAQALEVGLRVHMLPVSERHPVMPAYCLPWTNPKENEPLDCTPWLLERMSYSHDIHFDNHWAWQNNTEASQYWQGQLKGFLAQMPSQVLAVGCGPQGLCCYWDERGGKKVLSAIQDFLYALSERTDESKA